MIVFDLRCQYGGHVFEAWFGSSADYESQKQRGLLSCPLCGDTAIDKAVMAPAVGAKGNQTRDPITPSDSPATAASINNAPATTVAAAVPHAHAPAPDPQAIKSMLNALAKAQAEALKSSTWVGTEFADTARAMHEGEIDQQPIHGQASLDETRSLIEEGIEIMPLPFPVRPPGMDN
jgi:hypothetical protein